MADAFLSYSRKDKAFAIELKERLEAAGFEILFDLDDILGSEDWARRIADMIAAADHFVFVMSPDSCQSRVCLVEVNTAVELSKSFLPVAFRETPRDLVPEPIGARQWISGADPASCAEELRKLFTTSPDWLRRHTELTSRARDWHLVPRKSALLRGSDLERAEEWLAASEGKEPPPSALQKEFLEHSRKWRRRRRAVGASLALTAIVAGALGWLAIAAARRLSADNERVSIAADWLSRDPTFSALVLLEVVDPERTPYAVASLTNLASQAIAACEMSDHEGGVEAIQFSPDGTLVLTLASEGVARLWPVADCRAEPLSEIRVERGMDSALFTADSRGVIVLGPEEASLWGTDGTQVGSALPGEFKVAWLTRKGDVVALRQDFGVEVWTVDSGLVRKATYTPFANRPGYGAIASAFFSPKSLRLLIETHGNEVLAWKLGDPADAAVVPAAGLVGFSPDGASYARAVFTQELSPEYRRYYEVRVGRVAPAGGELRKGDHAELVDAASFSPDSRYLVTASRDGVVLVANLSEPVERRLLRLERHEGQIRGIAVSGERFVTFGDDRNAVLSRFDAPDAPVFLRGHIGPVTSAAFSPDGKALATGSEDGAARLWNLEEGPEPLSLVARGRTVNQVWFSPDDRFVVARSHSMSDWPLVVYLEAWSLESPSAALQLNEPPIEIEAVARHPLESSIAIAGKDGEIVLKPIAPGSTRRPIGNHPGVNALDFDENGRHLISGGNDGSLRLWDLGTAGQAEPVSLESPSALGLERVGVSHRGDVLASDKIGVYAWPVGAREEPVRLNPGDELIEAAAFDPAGAYVATAHAWNHEIRLWHADGRGLVRPLGAATETIEAMRFSPDGRYLIVTSKDETVRIWRSGRDEPPVVLRGHTSWVVDADFNRDATRVVTVSYDGSARLWNVDGSNEEVILRGATYTARFDSAGSRIVTGTGDGKVNVWSLDGKRLQAEVASRTRVCLDKAFRMRFLAEDAATAAASSARCRSRPRS
jgi:WD40 repeat protein